MKTTEKTLKEIYSLGNKETKDKLENEFPTLFAPQTELQKAIDYLTEEDCEVVKLRKLEKVEGINNLLAEQKLVVIFRAKNEKHIFDWDNSQEGKYFLWFYLGKDFRYYDCSYWLTDSIVSARLCLKNITLCKELGENKEIVEYFRVYLNQC